MDRAEDYRARATECDYRAERMHDLTVRANFREMARQWRFMAQQLERLEVERRSWADVGWGDPL